MPPVRVTSPLKLFEPESTQVPAPLFVMPRVVAPPLPMSPLMVLALALLPLSVRTVAPPASPRIRPPKFKVPAPTPAPVARLLAKV